MARLVVLLACAAVLMPATAQTAGAVGALQESLQSSIARLEPSLVAIVAEGPAGPLVVGTGFVLVDDGTFVTSVHTLRQPPGIQLKVRFRATEGKMVKFEHLLLDPKRDVALCRAALPEGALSRASPVVLAASSDVPPGTLVLISGFPLAAGNSSSHLGMVSSHSAGEEPLEVSAFINEGESGGPIVRIDDGKVIGMVSSVRIAPAFDGAGRGLGDQNSGLTVGARSEWISALMNRSKRAPEAERHR